MARNNIGRPRFYIDTYSYLKAIGLTLDESNPFKVGLNPTDQGTYPFEFNVNGSDEYKIWKYELKEQINENIIKNSNHGNAVVGFLGHNFASSQIEARVKIEIQDGNQAYGSGVEIVNYAGDDSIPEYDGFSLYKTPFGVTGDAFDQFSFRLRSAENEVSGTAKLGSIFIGTYYDIQAPDLNLKLNYDFSGTKTIQTKGGATLTNSSYTKPADWGEYGAWQLGNGANLRNGRKSWDLSFSFLSDTDVMPNLGVQNYEEGVVAEDILTGTDFFSQVINRTMGVGNLPFIFQPDGGADVEGQGNFNPDQFAICRFDMDSFTLTQVGINLYNCSVKIRESW